MKPRKNANSKQPNGLKGVELYEGTSLIETLSKMKENGEKPVQVSEMIYTEKKKGVIKAYDIRADRFEIGQERAEKIAAYKNAKEMREQSQGEPTKEDLNMETVEVKQDDTSQH